MTHYLIENDEKTADNNPSDIAIIMSTIDLLTESQPNGVNYVSYTSRVLNYKLKQ